MSKYWLLKGSLDAPGWDVLRKAYDDEEVEIVHLDPKVWAMVEADDAPKGFEGLTAVEPTVVKTAEEVVAALGEEAAEMLQKAGDAHTVLQRLGRTF